MEKLSQTHTLYRVKKHKPSGWVKRNDLKGEIIEKHGITDPEKITTRMNAFNNRELMDLANVHAQLGKDLKKLILPWDERGFGIVSNSRVPEVEKIVSDAKIDADLKLEIFLGNYSEHVINEKVIMKTAFMEENYPTVEQLRSKHSIEVDIAIVPDPDEDARAGWTTEMRNRYATQLRKQEREKVARATRDVVGRIEVSIKKVLDRMTTYDGKKLGSFNDTLIQNVRDMAAMLPEFNLTNDPEITATYQKILREICVLDTQELRDDEKLRADTAKSSKDILDRIGAFGQKDKD